MKMYIHQFFPATKEKKKASDVSLHINLGSYLLYCNVKIRIRIKFSL